MPEAISTDRIVQIVLALAAAGGLSFGGLSSSDATSCRELLQDERTSCAGTLDQIAGQYSDAMQVLRDICRDAR